MYAVHREIHPPTGIELSTYCHFFNNNDNNLVVVENHCLQVYILKEEKVPDDHIIHISKQYSK